MAAPGKDRSSTASGAWLTGLALGGLIGVTSISFALGILAIPILVASVALIAWKGPRLIAGAGLVTGWGLLWTVAIVQSTLSCLTIDRGPGRWCEPADMGPWLAIGIGLFIAGLAGSAFALRRSGT